MIQRGYTLSKDAAMRTANAVRWVEKMQPSMKPMTMPRNLPRGAGGTTTTSVEVDIVLIDKDIMLVDDEPKGITEADPANTLLPADIELTSDEISAGYSSANHIFQDPPDDDYSQNNLDPRELPLYQYTRRKVELKVYEAGDPLYGTCTAGASTTITLQAGSSDEDEYYTDETITLLDHYGEAIESRTITAYDGATRIATVDSAWTDNPVNGDDYRISVSRDLKLGHTIIDDPDNDRKIVRYKYLSVWYDDGKPFVVGEYQRHDYPDYPENEAFPPDGTGTYAEQSEGFFNRRFRGVVIGGVLITALCKPLPPPALVE
jgi:hypothetical protein